VSEYAEGASQLNGRTLSEAIDGYLATVATVKRVDLAQAIEEFIRAEEPRTRSVNGQRAQLSASYAYVRGIRLRRLGAVLPNTAVCDIKKAHLDVVFGNKPLGGMSAKSRNHYRATIRQFFSWCVRKDYLPSNHRLTEADSMRNEDANTAEILFYTPIELRTLLESADGALQPMIALGAMAGLRTAELLRLTWRDVWRVPGYIEVTASKAKTRQRRLIEICARLSNWLAPYREQVGKVWAGRENVGPERNENLFHEELVALCERAHMTPKTNGLRHGFCTYAYALHGEIWTAQMAGHSPQMLHANYRGLATKAEAEKWFAVAPVEADNVVPMKTSNSP
jgi:integrase